MDNMEAQMKQFRQEMEAEIAMVKFQSEKPQMVPRVEPPRAPHPPTAERHSAGMDSALDPHPIQTDICVDGSACSGMLLDTEKSTSQRNAVVGTGGGESTA